VGERRTYDLIPPSLFLSLLVTVMIAIAGIGRATLNQNVTAPIAATTTIATMDMDMTESRPSRHPLRGRCRMDMSSQVL